MPIHANPLNYRFKLLARLIVAGILMTFWHNPQPEKRPHQKPWKLIAKWSFHYEPQKLFSMKIRISNGNSPFSRMELFPFSCNQAIDFCTFWWAFGHFERGTHFCLESMSICANILSACGRFRRFKRFFSLWTLLCSVNERLYNTLCCFPRIWTLARAVVVVAGLCYRLFSMDISTEMCFFLWANNLLLVLHSKLPNDDVLGAVALFTQKFIRMNHLRDSPQLFLPLLLAHFGYCLFFFLRFFFLWFNFISLCSLL